MNNNNNPAPVLALLHESRSVSAAIPVTESDDLISLAGEVRSLTEAVLKLVAVLEQPQAPSPRRESMRPDLGRTE